MNYISSKYEHGDILKVLALEVFAIYQRFLMNLSDYHENFDDDRRFDARNCMLI